MTPFSATEPQAVSVAVTGLTPHTAYVFRLVVEQSTTESTTFSAGVGLTFTTPAVAGRPPAGRRGKHGTESLRSHQLTVSKGVVSIPVKCGGAPGAPCKGKLALSTRGKHGRAVACGRSRFSLAAPSSRTLKTKAGGGCLALLRHAPHHKLLAMLRETFTTGQPGLKASVTLAG